MGKPFGGMKKVGGGNSTSQASTDGFNQYLGNGLTNGNFAQAGNNMLNGQIGDPSQYMQYFNQLGGDGNAGINPVQYDSPQFQGMQFQNPGQVGTDYNAPQFQGMGYQDLGQVNTQAGSPSWQNTNLGGVQLGNPNQFGGMQYGDPNGGPSQPNVGGIDSQLLNGYGSRAQLGSAGSMNFLGPDSQAIQQIGNQQLDKSVADTRARYGASGGNPLGSGAQYAEATLRAQAAPQMVQALTQTNNAERGLNLESRSQDLQNFIGGRTQDVGQLGYLLGQRGQDVTQRGQSMDQYGNILGQNNQATLGMNSLGLQSQAQNNQGILGLNAQNLQQGMGQNQFNQTGSQFGDTFGQQGQQMNNENAYRMNQLNQNQNQFQNQFNQGNSQFGASLSQQGQGMNANIANQMNQLGLNQNQFMNSYGQNNAQFGAQVGNWNNQNAMQNQQQMNQYALGQGNIGLGMQSNQAQVQQNAYNQQMQAYLQQMGLNTAQRQQVYQPGWVQQGLGMAGQVAGIYKGFKG